MSGVVIELLLGGSLVVLAIHLLWRSDLYQAIVLFIVFGLIMTLVWAWLGAADVALAEAAIGAGLTGAMLMAAWQKSTDRSASNRERRSPPAPWGAILAATIGMALGGRLQFLLRTAPAPAVDLTSALDQALPSSGVQSPVTAVLMSFRGFDTLLEVGLLVAAWLAAVGPHRSPRAKLNDAGEIISTLGRLWAPLAFLVGIYVVWAGSRSSGGAFQSAALLAGTAILLRLTGVQVSTRRHWALATVSPVFGFAVFGIAAAAGLWSRGSLLSYPHGRAGPWIVAIELAMMTSLAALLFFLYCAVARKTHDP